MRTCTMPECDKPYRARGLCAVHWNQTYGTRTQYTITCLTCGAQHQTPRKDSRFCSLLCRDAEHRRNHLLPVLWVRPKWMDPRRTITQPVVSNSVRTWTAGDCRQCGTYFIDRQPHARFCSNVCSRRWHRKAWKVKANRNVSDAVRAQVYARDAGICQLCMTSVDMDLPPSNSWAPTLDHIICQSWTLLPDHRANNLRLAHRWCNSKRADERYAA